MTVLHFACIKDRSLTGVSVVVPQHVRAQSRFAKTALINVNGETIEDLEKDGLQLEYKEGFVTDSLPKPFDRPDICVFHECYRPQYLKIARMLRSEGIPYVVCPHGELREEAQQKKHLKKVAANILLFNSFINGALAVQCLSVPEMQATHFGKKKFIGTNGVDMPLKRKKSFSEEGARIVYIGRYEWKVKGLDLLMEAVGAVRETLEKENCVIELYGPDILGRLDAVRELKEKYDCRDTVRLNTEISGDDKRDKLLSSDIFIQTSRHEGMPMGILEAMSYGIPCIVSEGTTLGKTVEENGAGWNAGKSAQSIADAILKALSERDKWKEYGNNGAEYVRKFHSWDTVAEKTLEIYEALLG